MNDFILIVAVVVPTVSLGIWWVMRPTDPAHVAGSQNLPALLVRDGVLEHASEEALACLPIAVGAHTWEDLHDILAPQYPDFPRAPAPHAEGKTVLKGSGGDLCITWQARGASITMHSPLNPDMSGPGSRELADLRDVSDSLPFPAWKTDAANNVVWHNKAYAELKKRIPNQTEQDSDPLFVLPPTKAGTHTSRMKLTLEHPKMPEWFNVTRKPLGQGAVYHATSLTNLIHAEEAQRDFVQTLAKTFAQLSIGLAIFNRDRQLALFNPALTDLTGLSASFLSPRPTIDSFFDAMRENRRMPEPKNYKTWRQRMADLINAAETGRFEETWTLETGQTYRVTGRPHPDGAIAFLIEDISAEVSLTRNFRAELELGQSLVDTFEDALAVFSQTGVLTFSNKAYDMLWGFQHDSSFADVTITDAVRLWREKSTPNPLWQELQDMVMSLDAREEWTMPVCIKGQTPMQCKIVPITSGATVVRFSREPADLPTNKMLLGNANE